MAFSEIKPGQPDWLNVLNQSLKNNKWNYKHLSGTLINGCSGWCVGDIGYDEDMYIACITGFVTLPDYKTSTFSTNPFDGILDLKGAAIIGTAFLGNPKNCQNNFSPLVWDTAGNLAVRGATGDKWDDTGYTGWISMTFASSRSQMKI